MLDLLATDVLLVIYHEWMDTDMAVYLQYALCVPTDQLSNALYWLAHPTQPILATLRNYTKRPLPECCSPNGWNDDDIQWLPYYECMNILPGLVTDFSWHHPSTRLQPLTLRLSAADYHISPPLPSVEQVFIHRHVHHADPSTDTVMFPGPYTWPALRHFEVWMVHGTLTLNLDGLPNLEVICWYAYDCYSFHWEGTSCPHLRVLKFMLPHIEEPAAFYCPRLRELTTAHFPWRALHATQLTWLNTISSSPEPHEPIYPEVLEWHCLVVGLHEPDINAWLALLPKVETIHVSIQMFTQFGRRLYPPPSHWPRTLREIHLWTIGENIDDKAWQCQSARLVIHDRHALD